MLAEGYPQAAVPVGEHLQSHQGVKDGGAGKRHTEVEAEQPPVFCIFVKQHEVRLWSEHAGVESLVSVRERDNVKTNGLWDGEEEREDPDRHDLKDSEGRDAHPLHPAPGSHRTIPVDAEGTQVQDSDADRSFLHKWNQLTQKQAERMLRKRPARLQQLKDIDGFLYGQVHEVSEGQTGYQRVGPITHALVLVNNPQQSSIAHQPHHKHYDGDDRVDVLEVDVHFRRDLAGWGRLEFLDFRPV